MNGTRPSLTSAVERAALSIVGYVEEVSPAKITVRLTDDAPTAFALGGGTPMGFPKLNGYLLIPAGPIDVVGVVTWLGTRRDRTTPDDHDLVDLPFPTTVLHLLPVGVLHYRSLSTDEHIDFERGIPLYPSVGDAVHLPTSDQLDAVTAPHGDDPHIRIGVSTLGSNPAIKLDPTLLFGHHLAVLGNTGSGKSCTVATLIRSSVLAASSEIDNGKAPQTRFIILDPNGEYGDAFTDLPGGAKVIRPGDTTNPLVVPAWMWNGAEWASLARASAGTQHPVLMQALRQLRAATVGGGDDVEKRIRYFANDRHVYFSQVQSWGTTKLSDMAPKMAIGQVLAEVPATCDALIAGSSDDDVKLLLAGVKTAAQQVLNVKQDGKYFKVFSESDFDDIITATGKLCDHVGYERQDAGSEDAPIHFTVGALPETVQNLAAARGVSQHVDTMVLRLRSMLEDTRCKAVIAPPTDQEPTVAEWLESLVGAGSEGGHPVTVIDLSLIPTEIVHLITAVISRLLFEGLQRTRASKGIELPTVLVLEEAHTFVRDTQFDVDDMGATALRRTTIERIAREGRKFGLGLVISSQRPSELAPTVLSQCNTFMLHRLVNDRDQNLVRRLVPDAFGDLLTELPVLPTRNAAVLGLSVSAPTMVEIDELDYDRRPRSHNPPYWKLWTGASTPVDWDSVVADWTRPTTPVAPSSTP